MFIQRADSGRLSPPSATDSWCLLGFLFRNFFFFFRKIRKGLVIISTAFDLCTAISIYRFVKVPDFFLIVTFCICMSIRVCLLVCVYVYVCPCMCLCVASRNIHLPW